ncbi:MAG: carboxy-S-adenosyl-L-methionine synthase CmoA [Desulfobacula sp.]|nr:carboxy-S-adenosyl-L-methionine synthase CmoA [Desulfobacula sp.]
MGEKMEKDQVFACKKDKVKPFEFNEEVADVFDDMLNRSVPLYAQSIKRQAQLTAQFYQNNSWIYDLGCSHGNLGIKILDQFKKRGFSTFSMVGVDNSIPMIEKYYKRLGKHGNTGQIELVCGFLEDIKIKNASVVLINLTLQFLDVKKRDDLIKKIFKGMNSKGILLLTEKVIHPSEFVNDLQMEFYKKFKIENGYSRLEISQKRDALEKVLIPDTIQTHENRILKAGFTHFDVWLKWFNFASMVAIKQ